MTKNEIRERLKEGKTLCKIFNFTDGQECLIYNGEWNPGDEVIYIPDVDLNEIEILFPLAYYNDNDEIQEDKINEAINNMYTGKDFMNLADDNEEFAKDLFDYCDWQHPSSALDELRDEEEYWEDEKEGETEIDSYPELKRYDEEHTAYFAREEDVEYEIIFEVDKERYYCYIDAPNIDEALGVFFVNHPHITYDMVVDHMEV